VIATDIPPATARAAAGISIVNLETPRQQERAADLYRSVFGYADAATGVSPKLLRGLLENSGSALGAFDADGRILGFCYGFSAVDNSGQQAAIYHYSQATAIAAGAQGRGIGRLLKRAQADVAVRTGAATMRWSYDPYLARNAHFNLNSLGARGRWFVPDFYREPDTDRIVVEWELDEGRAALRSADADRRWRAVVPQIQDVVAHDAQYAVHNGQAGDEHWVVFPSTSNGHHHTGQAAAREELRLIVTGYFADGLAAVSCGRLHKADAAQSVGDDRSLYIFGKD
jgi:predicted GNAT superfamily acetyltransferase